MLRLTDRVRILCHVLGLSRDELTQRFAASSSLTLDRAKEQVGKWWDHHQQPVKSRKGLVSVLQGVADARSFALNVDVLWDAPLTPGAFAKLCGTSFDGVLPCLSPGCISEVFEEVDRHPPLHLLRTRAVSDGAKEWFQNIAGSYLIYRVHSSERILCQEAVTVAPGQSGYFMTGEYHQYAEGRRKRTIELSIFVMDGFIHAFGAYNEQRIGVIQNSMVHLVIMRTPYRRIILPGVLLGTMDVGNYAAAQRILVRKVSSKVKQMQNRVEVARARGRLTNVRSFLEMEEGDERTMLKVSLDRVTRMLERR